MKYMGSKSRIAKEIVPIIQEYIDKNNISTYIEPFVGGANVIDKIKCENRIGTDKNSYLVGLLKGVSEDRKVEETLTKEYYDTVRTSYNQQDDKFDDFEYGRVGFLGSYNGRFFDGGYAKSGYEKLKNGGERYRDYYREARDNLLSQDLKDIEFRVRDYREWTEEISKGGFVVYCDPPYANTKEYKSAKDFDWDEFWALMRKWSENNIVIISEQTAPEDFECIWEKPVSRSIKSTDKSRATEKMFKYKGE